MQLGDSSSPLALPPSRGVTVVQDTIPCAAERFSSNPAVRGEGRREGWTRVLGGGGGLPKEARHQNTRRLLAEEVEDHVTDAPSAERFAQTRRGDVSYGNEAPSAGGNRQRAQERIAVAIIAEYAVLGPNMRRSSTCSEDICSGGDQRGQRESRWRGRDLTDECRVHGQRPGGAKEKMQGKKNADSTSDWQRRSRDGEAGRINERAEGPRADGGGHMGC
jgi:hypothetical protein